jgi:hypothetical protein
VAGATTTGAAFALTVIEVVAVPVPAPFEALNVALKVPVTAGVQLKVPAVCDAF